MNEQEALAIFDEKQQADAAVQELNRAGFPADEIVVARQMTNEETRELATDKEKQGIVYSVARYFSNLVGFGEAHGHEADFEMGRTIVRVKSGARDQEALALMLRHGGYNRISRPDTSTPAVGGIL